MFYPFSLFFLMYAAAYGFIDASYNSLSVHILHMDTTKGLYIPHKIFGISSEFSTFLILPQVHVTPVRFS